MWSALQNNNERVMEGQHGGSLSSGEKPEASAGSQILIQTVGREGRHTDVLSEFEGGI